MLSAVDNLALYIYFSAATAKPSPDCPPDASLGQGCSPHGQNNVMWILLGGQQVICGWPGQMGTTCLCFAWEQLGALQGGLTCLSPCHISLYTVMAVHGVQTDRGACSTIVH